MDSPTIFPTTLIRRYFTVPATMTDECTDEYLRLVFQTFTDSCNPSVCHTITDGINPSVYFKREMFFLLTDIATEYGITNERKADGRILLV
jgi:hypothetical protein